MDRVQIHQIRPKIGSVCGVGGSEIPPHLSKHLHFGDLCDPTIRMLFSHHVDFVSNCESVVVDDEFIVFIRSSAWHVVCFLKSAMGQHASRHLNKTLQSGEGTQRGNNH